MLLTLRKKFSPGLGLETGSPAEDLDSNPGPGENFSLKVKVIFCYNKLGML